MQIFLWGIVDKFSLSKKIWRASFSLTREKFAPVDGQQGKCDKDIIDFLGITETCQGKLADRLHEQGNLVNGKL